MISHVKYQKIEASVSGDNTLITGVAGERQIVVGIVLVAAGTVAAKLKSAATEIYGPMQLLSGSGFALPSSNVPWLIGGVGESIILNLGGAVAVGGCIIYQSKTD